MKRIITAILALTLITGLSAEKASAIDVPHPTGEAEASGCEAAVRHVHAFTEATAVGASDAERVVMATVVVAAVAACESEGLSDAARGCIMAAGTYRELWQLASCKGFSGDPPDWLVGFSAHPDAAGLPDWADATPAEMREQLDPVGP